MKIGITASIYVSNLEHKKYLDFATKSIFSLEHSIVWMPVENYVHSDFAPLVYAFDHTHSETRVLRSTGMQSVSKAWNIGIKEGITEGCDYILVVNTDIVFRSNAIDRLVKFAVNHPEAVMWTASECKDLRNLENCPENEKYSEHPCFPCFMVKNDFFSHVGEFDENFVPAYFEDDDMLARLTLAGKIAYSYDGARFFHFGSRTILSDKELFNMNKRTYPECHRYFIRKWGNTTVNILERMREVYYKHPYNEENKPLSYWRTPPR